MLERQRITRLVQENRLVQERRVLTAKLTGLALFVVCTTWVTMWSVTTFQEYKENWDIQNECIAELISEGVERRDINRHLDGCTITVR